jgi:phosphate uptake regulator
MREALSPSASSLSPVLTAVALSEKALDRTLQALFERNSDLAQEVIDKDDAI